MTVVRRVATETARKDKGLAYGGKIGTKNKQKNMVTKENKTARSAKAPSARASLFRAAPAAGAAQAAPVQQQVAALAQGRLLQQDQTEDDNDEGLGDLINYG